MKKEPLDFLLRHAGVELIFANFSIFGILNFDVTVFHHGEASPYEIERKLFTIQVASQDIVENSIVSGMQFTLDDTVYTHTFSVNYAEPDFTGLSEMKVDFISTVVI